MPRPKTSARKGSTMIRMVPPPGPGTALARGLDAIRSEAPAPRAPAVPPEAIVAEMAAREADLAHQALVDENAMLRAAVADRDATIRGLEAELDRADERAADAAREARVEAHRTARHGGRLPSILAIRG